MPKIITDLSPLQLLQQKWGYDHFRPFQRQIIEAVLSGKDTLALLPTGGGKSITFQLPALMMEGVTLVISPLISLIKDQLNELSRLHIRSAGIYSGMQPHQIRNKLDSVLYGDYKLLYVSPERLQSEYFRTRLSLLKVSMVVVDEAHCISQWGYDFRPEYLQIANIRTLLPEGIPVLALTASATPEVARDICEKLEFGTGYSFFEKSFYRKKLSYVIRRTYDKPRMLYHILSRVEGSALVYVRTRREAQKYAAFLEDSGLNATYYHALMKDEEKTRKQTEWQSGQIRIMVCTTAFGMGINKKDVRLVVHPLPPSDLESYYQEAGRAGRDDKQSYAVILYSPGDDEQRLYDLQAKQYPSRKEIRTIYDHICNYLGIPLGGGLQKLYNIDLWDIRKVFGYDLAILKASLRILERSNYMIYREEDYRQTWVHFAVNRNDLYDRFTESERIYDDLCEILLRNYTGLFSEFVSIDELKIAKMMGISKYELMILLGRLASWRIIDYVPGAKIKSIRLPIARLPIEKVLIPHEAYEDMQERDSKRMLAMVDYIQHPVGCRSNVIQSYFGEKKLFPCGYCENCLSEKPLGITYRIIDELISSTIEVESLTCTDVLDKYNTLSSNDLVKIGEFLDSQNLPVQYISNKGVFQYRPELTDENGIFQ